MAQTTKKSSAKKPAATAKKTPVKKNTAIKSAQSTKKAEVYAKKAMDNREKRTTGAIVCLFLGLWTFIGYFNVDAIFFTYFCGFIKGIVGCGYYIFPPILFICAYNLAFNKDKPVAFKVVSALFMPLFLGSLYHLFSAGIELPMSKTIFSSLFESGKAMTSGGVLSGLLAIGLKSVVSIYGALPVFIIGLMFCSMSTFGLTVQGIVTYFHDRPQYDYLPELPEKPARADIAQNSALNDMKMHTSELKRNRKAIDIPLDDVVEKNEDYVEEKVGFFNTKPRVKTPDQILSQGLSKPAASPARVTKAAMITENVKPLSVAEAAAVAGVESAAVSQISSDSAKTVVGAATVVAKKITHDEVEAETEEFVKTIEKTKEENAEAYKFPSVNLLRSGSGRASVDGREEIALNRERLESTIRSFGVNASITGITRGPTVTRYDLELEQGVKLAKLTNLAGDLALSLGVVSVRIAPIPDKISTVGIEVPNKIISIVYLHDIIDSASFKTAQSRLSFAIGEDIAGNAIVGNIAKLPHLLIAGTTGSGKSVCMNSLILSILYKATPEEVRLIMIDPKMVELGIYNGIPHLFVPVVTDPKKAAGALQWAVVEMLKRYRLFSEIGVRDLTGYNAHQKTIGGQTIPRVIIVIDELADLMLVASKEVEESICRVAQMGRASGMHLVIATQRPSADVITGLMKANIPSRIAFAVSSAMESRIILDSSGAEKLIGAGDMLYSPLGVGKPLRVQGAFVSDEEREKVIDFVKEDANVEYSEDIIAQIEKAAEDRNAPSDNDKSDASDAGNDYDDLLPQAVDVIFETKQASVSMLQRRLKLGYSRAARIVDQMEEIGIVGPFEGSKPRQVLITKQQWQEMQSSHGLAPVGSASDQVSFVEFEETPTEDWKD